MAVLSQDIKERIVRSVMDDGLSQAETAQRLSVAESTVSRTMRAYRERGTVAPLEYVHGPSPKLGDEHLEWLRTRVAESPFLSTYELTPLFNEAFPEVAVHRSSILRALHGLGMSVKKRPRSRPLGSRKS
jgi:transposase